MHYWEDFYFYFASFKTDEYYLNVINGVCNEKNVQRLVVIIYNTEADAL